MVGVDGGSAVAVIDAAIAGKRAWLMHPALGAITDPEAGDAERRVRMLIAYVRAQEASQETIGRRIVLDPRACMSGIIENESWAANNRLRTHAGKWRTEWTTVTRALSLLHEHLPIIADWVSDVAPVVTPLFNLDLGRYRSWSWASIPGTVFIDTHAGAYAFLESLIHEGAHRYFLLAEANAPLAEVTGPDFSSPLRTELRPIRAILFAYHALAYMSAFYTDYCCIADDVPEHTALRLAAEVRDAREVLYGRSHLLTPAGLVLLSRTDEVAFARAG